MPRRFPIFQFPNRPLITAMVAQLIARTTRGQVSRSAMQLSRLAWLMWSAQEVAAGANWFRRSLGAAIGAYTVAGWGRGAGHRGPSRL